MKPVPSNESLQQGLERASIAPYAPVDALVPGRHGVTWYVVEVVVWAVIGAAVCWGLGSPFVRELRLDLWGQTATAHVLETSGDSGDGYYTTRVSVVADGRPTVVTYGSEMFASGAPAKGETTDVEYLAADPTLMRTAGSHQWVLMVIVSFELLVFAFYVPKLIRRLQEYLP